MKKIVAVLIAALVLSFTALAAEDANGTWKASFDTPGGTMENTFLFKVEAGKVTGTISSQLGTQQIMNGTVDGDKIKFSVNSDFGVLSYSGVVKGDEIALTVIVGDGQFTLDMNAKRVKT